MGVRGQQRPSPPPPPPKLAVSYRGILLREDDPRHQLVERMLRYFDRLGMDLPDVHEVVLRRSSDGRHWNIRALHVAEWTE